MFKVILATTFKIMLLMNITKAYPQAVTDGTGGQDSCAQYQTQCVEGSGLVAQGAQGGAAAFPNNPLPVSQVNMTAIQQMPYCQAMAQACQVQGNPPPTPPSVPAVPAVPTPSAPTGFFNSLKSIFTG